MYTISQPGRPEVLTGSKIQYSSILSLQNEICYKNLYYTWYKIFAAVRPTWYVTQKKKEKNHYHNTIKNRRQSRRLHNIYNMYTFDW